MVSQLSRGWEIENEREMGAEVEQDPNFNTLPMAAYGSSLILNS
jgi:hypothetical protein